MLLAIILLIIIAKLLIQQASECGHLQRLSYILPTTNRIFIMLDVTTTKLYNNFSHNIVTSKYIHTYIYHKEPKNQKVFMGYGYQKMSSQTVKIELSQFLNVLKFLHWFCIN